MGEQRCSGGRGGQGRGVGQRGNLVTEIGPRNYGARSPTGRKSLRGTYAYDGRTIYHVSAPAVKVLDTTGAGDNFHGAIPYCLGRGMSLPDAVKFSNVFASLTCESLGGHTVVPDAGRIEEVLNGGSITVDIL